MICLVWFDAKRPGKQFFSHAGTEPPLPGYYQYLFYFIFLFFYFFFWGGGGWGGGRWMRTLVLEYTKTGAELVAAKIRIIQHL